MRIVDITEFYSERGGVRGHLDLKGQILRQAGHHHLIVAPGPADEMKDLPGGARELQSAENRPGCRPRGTARAIRIAGPTLPYDSNYHLLWRVDKVRNIVICEKPDVLEINSPYLAPWSMRKLPPGSVGIKTFWWHADFIESYARTFVNRWVHGKRAEPWTAPLWSLVRAISARCDATFAASRQQANNLMLHGVPGVRHLPFGIDKDIFTPQARSDAWRAQTLGPRSNVPIFVAMGRLSAEKQWPVVFEGFFRASQKRPLLLLLFGDGPERAKLEALARGRSDVRFMGFEHDRKRLATALSSSDAFVHGCPFETFGLSVAQAIASGLPVVVPDRGGAAELAHPSFSEVFRAGDGEACSEAIGRLLVRDVRNLRARAIARRDAIFGAKEQVEKTVEAYEELLQIRRSGSRPT